MEYGQSAQELKRIDSRLKLLRGQRVLAFKDWYVLLDKTERTKEEGKELQKLSTLISSLNNEISGLQRSFEDAVQRVVHDIINS